MRNELDVTISTDEWKRSATKSDFLGTRFSTESKIGTWPRGPPLQNVSTKLPRTAAEVASLDLPGGKADSAAASNGQKATERGHDAEEKDSSEKPAGGIVGASTSSGWADMCKKEAGDWRCVVCSTSNPATATDACLACKTPKPGAVKGEGKKSDKSVSE